MKLREAGEKITLDEKKPKTIYFYLQLYYDRRK